jgi:hypothetical protein
MSRLSPCFAVELRKLGLLRLVAGDNVWGGTEDSSLFSFWREQSVQFAIFSRADVEDSFLASSISSFLQADVKLFLAPNLMLFLAGRRLGSVAGSW